jgi:hypothetical protein
VYAGDTRPTIIDELLYRLQSRLGPGNDFALGLPNGTERFFLLRQAFLSPRGMVTQYPPGWPWLLAASRVIGLEAWAPALCGGATIVATAALARRVVAPAAGLCAAILLAASPEFLLDSSMYYSHAASALCLVLAALAIVPAEDHRARSVAGWLTFGALVGCATLIRPITGLTVATSIAAWSLVRGCGDARMVGTRALAAMVGAAPFGALLLWYQARTTGNAFEAGYTAANGALHAMGFGMRGFLSPRGSGIPHAVTQYFGWRGALAASLHRAWDAGLATTSAALVIPLCVMGWVGGRAPVRIRSVALFLPLPLVLAFFFYSDPRFYCELLPFIAVGLAYLIERLGMNSSRRRELLAIVLVAALATHAARALTTRHNRASAVRLYDAAGAAANRCGPIIVFASDEPSGSLDRSEPHLETLYWYNVVSFGGPVLAARDLGVLDTLLTAAEPGRAVFKAPGGGSPLQLVSAPASAPPDCLRWRDPEPAPPPRAGRATP